MTLERTAATSNLVDVLDRVLDKGIVIDAWVRVSLVGIDLVTVEARRRHRTRRFLIDRSAELASAFQAGWPPGWADSPVVDQTLTPAVLMIAQPTWRAAS